MLKAARISPKLRFSRQVSRPNVQKLECTRKYTTEAPPPAQLPKKKGGVFLKLLGLTTVGLAGTTVYIWYDDDFKKKVEDNVPYSKEVLEQVLKYFPTDKPKMPSMPSITLPEIPFLKKGKDTTDPLESTEVKPLKKETSLPQKKQTEESTQTKSAELKPEKKVAKTKKDVPTRPSVAPPPSPTAEQIKAQMLAKEADEAAENAALETIVTEVMTSCRLTTEQAVSSQNLALEATEEHGKLMKKAMEDPSVANKDQQWFAVTRAADAKGDAKKVAERLTNKARSDIEKLKTVIEDGKHHTATRGNKVLIDAQGVLGKLQYDLDTTINKVSASESITKMLNEYKDLIEKGKEQLRREVESVSPSVTLGKKGKKLNEEELNSLIAHAHRRIEQLQRQVAEQRALEQKRIDDAMDNRRREDEELTRGVVQVELEKQKGQFEIEKQIWESIAREQMEQELRQQLARQAAAHSDHLADVLRIQRKELILQHEEHLREKLITEHVKIQKELDGWIQRLKGIEAAVEGRAEQEKIGRKAQELWLACQTLQKMITNGRDGGTTPDEKLKPLANEFMAVREAGNEHPFVNQVIQTVPEEAIQRGVWTEEELAKRFVKVKKICRRVAMIDETGGSMFKYLLSYFQSILIVDYAAVKASEEIDPEKLDTFTILANADRCLSEGDLAQAVRYMNQLKGEPYKVASGWLQEALLLLETQQAAHALLGHASARGLGSLF